MVTAFRHEEPVSPTTVDMPPGVVPVRAALASVSLHAPAAYAVSRAPLEKLELAGVVIDPSNGRMVVPVVDACGRLRTYVARKTDQSPEEREYVDASGETVVVRNPKYLNAKRSRPGDTFFVGARGDGAIDHPAERRPIAVVEGALDVIPHIDSKLVLYAAALGGVKGPQVERLVGAARRGRSVVLVPDVDALAKAEIAKNQILAAVPGSRVGVVNLSLPGGSPDPDEIPTDLLDALVLRAVADGVAALADMPLDKYGYSSHVGSTGRSPTVTGRLAMDAKLSVRV